MWIRLILLILLSHVNTLSHNKYSCWSFRCFFSATVVRVSHIPWLYLSFPNVLIFYCWTCEGEQMLSLNSNVQEPKNNAKQHKREFLPEKYQNNAPRHRCHDASTTRCVHLWLFQNIPININRNIPLDSVHVNPQFEILSQSENES